MWKVSYYVIILFLLTSCASSKVQEDLYLTREKVSLLEEQNRNLEKRVDNLSTQIYSLISKIDALNYGTHQNTIESDNFTHKKENSNREAKAGSTSTIKQYNRKSTSTISDYNGRCQAITKKGTQCKRTAKPGSKYCWQHGN